MTTHYLITYYVDNQELWGHQLIQNKSNKIAFYNNCPPLLFKLIDGIRYNLNRIYNWWDKVLDKDSKAELINNFLINTNYWQTQNAN